MIAVFAILAFLASTQAQCPGTGGVMANGQCWYISSFASATNNCDSFCVSIGAVADANEIINIAGSGAANTAGCQAVIDAFGFQAVVIDASGTQCQNSGLGCFFNAGQSLRCTSPATLTSATATFLGGGRYCACNAAANKYFNIFLKNKLLSMLFSPQMLKIYCI
jgi:hypothetical protein